MSDDTPRNRGSRRRGPDSVTFSAGLLALAVSVYVMAGGFNELDMQWVLALGAVCVGAIMLAASLRTRRDH